MNERFRLAVVSAGTSDPSSTRLLADRIAERTVTEAAQRGREVQVSVVELRELASDIANAVVSQLLSPKLREAITVLAAADGLVASGLFKSFFDLLDNDLLIGKPVVLAATAVTSRHALVADDQLRPLFAYLRALPVPTSLFAAPEDWADPALNQRASRAARELVLLMESGFARAVRDEGWDSYQHEFGNVTDPEDDDEPAVEFDTDLMRLAAGGSTRQHRAS